jgi:hypothetical protein
MTETDEIRHLTEVQIYELATGESGEAGTERHVVSCERCASQVAETRRLLATLETFDPRLAPPGRLEAELARRIRADRDGRGPSRLRALAGLAAAIICFAVGAFSHALWTESRDRPAPSPVPDAPTPSLAIQRAGTEYVAAIATLADEMTGATAEELRTGREVALAAMSGAAFELRRLDDSDRQASEILRLVDDAWRRTAGEVAP